ALFSGVAPGTDALDSTWVLQLGPAPMWSRIELAVRPLARNGSCMVYDGARDRFVMFGGGLSDTWSLSLDPSPRWGRIEQDEGSVPYSTDFTQAVYDATRQRTLMFGGGAKYFYSGDAYNSESSDLWSLTTDGFARWEYLPHGFDAQRAAGMSLFIDPVADRL